MSSQLHSTDRDRFCLTCVKPKQNRLSEKTIRSTQLSRSRIDAISSHDSLERKSIAYIACKSCVHLHHSRLQKIQAPCSRTKSPTTTFPFSDKIENHTYSRPPQLHTLSWIFSNVCNHLCTRKCVQPWDQVCTHTHFKERWVLEMELERFQRWSEDCVFMFTILFLIPIRGHQNLCIYGHALESIAAVQNVEWTYFCYRRNSYRRYSEHERDKNCFLEPYLRQRLVSLMSLSI